MNRRTTPGDESQDAVTAAVAGINTDEQIRIALQTVLTNGGSATMAQIRDAVAKEIACRHPGKTLSVQGYATLCNTVNTAAVRARYIYKYDPANPGWRITSEGREFLTAPEAQPEVVFNAEAQSPETEPPSVVRWAAFERHVLDLMKAMHPGHAWYHQGRHTQNERGVDILGDRVSDGDVLRVGVQVKLHRPNNEPTDREWQKFLAGCFVRRIHKAVFVTSGSLSSRQRREAGEGNIVVIEGRAEIDRLSTQYALEPFAFYDEAESGTSPASECP